MRSPIFVRTKKFNIKEHGTEIIAIRDCFERYLESYPVKTTRSKTSLMGPIGKVLQGARTGKWDTESLAGYALNIHLANDKTKGIISQDARQALREGVDRLLRLLEEVPVTAQDKVLDQIDYGIYFMRRVKGLERLENIRQDFIAFLKGKYGTTETLAQAWGGKAQDFGEEFEKVRYPSRRMFAVAIGQMKTDIGDFAKQAELRGYELIEDEEE
ncbi:MAG: hypothetical protein ACYCVD_15670 [Desulfitobacteriaceae bacterium]